jgi:hypothetical protein
MKKNIPVFLLLYTSLSIAILPTYCQDKCKVLCYAQYSESIGGKNEGIEGVIVSISGVSEGVQMVPYVYFTDENGQAYLFLSKGKTYLISVVYEGENENVIEAVRLQYQGEPLLLISVDPSKPLIHDIVFLAPSNTQNTQTINLLNVAWFGLGIIVGIASLLMGYKINKIKSFVR